LPLGGIQVAAPALLRVLRTTPDDRARLVRTVLHVDGIALHFGRTRSVTVFDVPGRVDALENLCIRGKCRQADDKGDCGAQHAGLL
jgi:hypothetical protein